MQAKRARLLSFVRAPLDDYLAALDALLPRRSLVAFAAALVAALVSWMIYVPLHELAHAYGCIWTGGSVSRLEIDPIYGAAWLAEYFPFVAVGSEYAGQLTGFDTGGSDLVYLATDFAPFLMTIVIGVPLLRFAPRIRNRLWAFVALGASIPIAYAPFISLPGDYYEMGSIVVSRFASAFSDHPVERWRSDDVFLLVERLGQQGGGPFDWAVVGGAALLGAALALTTYSAGAAFATALQVAPSDDRRISGEGTSA